MRPITRLAVIASLCVAGLVAQAVPTPAQSKPVLRVEDSGRWESLVLSKTRLGLSPDGSVLAYRVDRSNWEDELRVTRVADGRTLVVPYGRDPEYSNDGRWLKYAIGQSQEAEDQLRRDRRPVRDGLGLLQLDTFTEARFTDVESASFSADGAFLAMERYPTRAAARGGARRVAADSDTPRVFVRALTGAAPAELAFDNVQSFEWQPDQGHALAMLMGGDANGGARAVLVNPAASSATATTVLDDSPATFSRLTWRPGGADLAFLRSRAGGGGDRLAFDLVVVRHAATPARSTLVYDSARDAGAPANTRVVDYRALAWSTDGRTVFVGIADNARSAATESTASDVRIWHWSDVEVMPRQVENVDAARRRNRLAAIHIDDARLVPISLSQTSRATPIDGTTLAWVADWTPYALTRTLGRPSADLSLVDYRTGQRAVFATNVDDNDVHARPGGGALVFLRDDHLWSLNTTTRALTDLSLTSGAALVDVDADTTAAHKPLFGVAGWSNDGALLAYDRYDIWRIAPDGGAGIRLTDGAATRTRHRVALMNDADADALIDLARPLYVALFGERTKQFGYARLAPGRPLERLIFENKRVDHLTTSVRGNVFAYTAQAFDDAPDIFLAGPTLTDARAVTSINPQQSQYAWGTSAVIDYTTARGDTLQAALYHPAGYVAGRRYPTIVTLYERLSDEVHDYVPPSDMDEANISVF
ncbi:MAG: hypothetical protein KAY59_11780, partial [Acidobacteria bacterium]|nr:hypothetical protein [Acidobacteriota bacterium]